MSGKTTIGRIIAEKINFNFYDTDLFVSKNHNHSIKNIISKYGEDFFRIEESKVIKDFASKKGVVISIGGGAANKLTVNSIKKYTHRIWLKCSIDVLMNRYEPDENVRPLLYNTNNIKKSLNEYFKFRNVFYSDSANIEIDSDMHTPHELSNQILSHINEKN